VVQDAGAGYDEATQGCDAIDRPQVQPVSHLDRRGAGPRPRATQRSPLVGTLEVVSAAVVHGATLVAERTVMPVSPASAMAHVHQMTRWCAAQRRSLASR
jgi:hypothetical protein